MRRKSTHLSYLYEPFSVLSLLLVVTSLVQYSRLITVFAPNWGAVGLANIALALVYIPIAASRPRIRLFEIKGIICLVVVLLIYINWSIQRFGNQSGLSNGFNSIANFNGLFLVFPAIYLIDHIGTRSISKLLFVICSGYCCIYCFLSIILRVSGHLGNADLGDLILYDGLRGHRLFANSCSIVYVIFYSLHRLLYQRRVDVVVLGLGCVAVRALFLAQSRMSIISFVIATVIVGVFSTKTVGRVTISLVIANIAASLFAIQNIDELAQRLYAADPYSLGVRSSSLLVAKWTFQSHPILGLGYSANTKLYETVFKVLFYPDDLGGVGIITCFGLIGFGLISAYSISTALGVVRSFSRPGLTPLGMVGLYIVIYNFTWPTGLYGDGALFGSILIASRFAPDLEARLLFPYIRKVASHRRGIDLASDKKPPLLR